MRRFNSKELLITDIELVVMSITPIMGCNRLMAARLLVPAIIITTWRPEVMHDANGCYQLLLEGISHGHLTQSLTTDGDGYHVAPFF